MHARMHAHIHTRTHVETVFCVATTTFKWDVQSRDRTVDTKQCVEWVCTLKPLDLVFSFQCSLFHSNTQVVKRKASVRSRIQFKALSLVVGCLGVLVSKSRRAQPRLLPCLEVHSYDMFQTIRPPTHHNLDIVLECTSPRRSRSTSMVFPLPTRDLETSPRRT